MKKLLHRYHGIDGIVNACMDATIALWLTSILLIILI
jgi:hypothetical protein